MSNMGDTFTGKIVDVGRTAVRNNKGWTISGVSVFVIAGFLFTYGGKVLDLIVTNAPAYRTIEMKVDKVENELRHNRHIVESQNFILGVMLESDMITTTEYRATIHAVTHRRDSL